MKTKGKNKNLPKKAKSNSTSAPETRAAQLTKLFLKTPEMQECQVTAGTIQNQLDPEDTITIKIDLPKQFVRLAEFLEEKSAAERGVTPAPLAKVLRRTLENYFHEQLHFLIVQPAAFGYYRALWNRFCVAQGAPEEKIPDPMLGAAKRGREEGPF